MAEEDEIDILSEFTMDNILEKSEHTIYNHSLNCDCLAPWSSDHTSHSLWDTNVHSNYSSDLSQEQLYDIPDDVECTGLSPDFVDNSGWSTAEKNLLIKGIEIYGKRSDALAQFIGSKTSNEIKMYLKSSSFLNANTMLDGTIVNHSIQDGADGIILDDTEIPASIEEVIAVVTTATPTVPINSYNKSSSVICPKVPKGRPKKYQHMSTDNLHLKKKMTKLFEYRNMNNTKRMFNKKKTNHSYNGPSRNSNQFKHNNFGVKAKCKIKVPDLDTTLQNTTFKESSSLVNSIIPSLNGEEVIKMKKEELEEDVESDIEVDVEDCNSGDRKPNTIASSEMSANFSENVDTEQSHLPLMTNPTSSIIPTESIVSDDLLNANDEVLQMASNLDVPKCEVILEHNIVSDLEKIFNKEFFCGRPAKTPERYLKIRNHILNMWCISKPCYVTKTSVRSGLKHCGDVNSISRVHQLLEQIGAINFGCSQMNYIRPLSNLFNEHTPYVKEKPISLQLAPVGSTRPRMKRKFTNDGEGGLTLTHNEIGDVINTTVVNEEPASKSKPYSKKPTIRLIYCKPFSDDHPQKYNVLIHLTPLLLMDFHAHISHTEVMGLIGGRWNAESRKLIVTCYIPCRNIASTATHCDMCPISQAEAADAIHSEGLDILGWFHSHPTFAPEPSQQDIDTQLSVQQWIGYNKPCIGLILSPFSAHGALIASPFRCLIVDKRNYFEDQYVPYKFKIELVSSNLNIDSLLSQAWGMFNKDCNINDRDKVDFKRPYFLDTSISYLDKFISSVKMHLAKCADINKMSCDLITSGLSNICLNKPLVDVKCVNI